VGINIKYVLCLSSFNKNRQILTVLVKLLNIVFDKILSGGSQVVPCRQTDKTEVQT